jgi:hypothetical protein
VISCIGSFNSGRSRKGRAVGLAVLLWGQLASAQASTPEPAPQQQPIAAKPSNTPDTGSGKTPAESAAEQVQAQTPDRYGPAFYSGAQAEFAVPDLRVSSLLFGYDAVWTQVDLSLGMGIGSDSLNNKNTNDLYNVALRFTFPIHRGIIADYALGGGGGATIFNPPKGSAYVIGTAALGARFRVFLSPNVAMAATLGFAAFIRGEHSSLLLGARPLGAASVVYFFR